MEVTVLRAWALICFASLSSASRAEMVSRDSARSAV